MREKYETVRDRLWLFASRPHDDDPYLAGPEVSCKWSRITPAEGAFMLGTPNLMMIESDGIPVPFSKDAYGYLESFCRLKKVLWSCTGSGGFRNGNEEEFICAVAEKYPNLCGGFMDDFAYDHNKARWRTEEEARSLIREIRRGLEKASRPMELWATVYMEVLKRYPDDICDPLDVLTLWSRASAEPGEFLQNFEAMESRFPHKRKALGLYLYDYTNRKGPDLQHFQAKCETALRLLKERRIEAMIFLTNCTMGIGLQTERWLREWLDRVGDEPLAQP